MFSIDCILLRHLLLILILTTANCDNLLVKTDSGYVRGVALRTLLQNKEYLAYRGIPYAKPPVGSLRFKAPVPIAKWPGILQANDYGYSCLVIDQSKFLPSNNTQSEDCLYLNIFTPVTTYNKVDSNKAVMFFIHGGAFTEGDGTNGFYGADFIVEYDVVLVTINYRLGPLGFASFDLKGFTGNMGFKDQQLALQWVKKNIKYFGGNPNLITVFGESAGGVSVHLHLLSDTSRKLMKRAIAMSGSAFNAFALYKPNNHVELFKQIFELDAQATGSDVLRFMLKAPLELILRKTPAIYFDQNLVRLYFGAVIEDVKKADNPFLIRHPLDIYKETNVSVDAMFGVTSAEYIVHLDQANFYSWIGPIKNYSNIGLPFTGLKLSPESTVYREQAKKIYDFYFGKRVLEPSVENLNIYLQMGTDVNFVYPAHQSLKLHAKHADTFCYENQLELNLNAVKITYNIQYLYGMAHFEDLQYLFLSKKYAQLYKDVLGNPDDPINQKTLKALQFVPKFFTDYAKRGRPYHFGSSTGLCNACIAITNDGLKPMIGLKKHQMKFWDTIYDNVEPWIINPVGK